MAPESPSARTGRAARIYERPAAALRESAASGSDIEKKRGILVAGRQVAVVQSALRGGKREVWALPLGGEGKSTPCSAAGDIQSFAAVSRSEVHRLLWQVNRTPGDLHSKLPPAGNRWSVSTAVERPLSGDLMARTVLHRRIEADGGGCQGRRHTTGTRRPTSPFEVPFASGAESSSCRLGTASGSWPSCRWSSLAAALSR